MEIKHTIGATGTFVLRALSGTIRIAGSDGDEAIVVARAGHGDLPEMNVERSAGRLLVEPQQLGLKIMRRHEADIDFSVTLPRAARLDVKSVSADVIASGLSGEQEYRTVSGDIHLAGGAGRVSIQSVSGDVHSNGGKRLEFTSTTTSGDVHLDADLVDYLRVRTVSGDVRLTGRLADGPRHSVETVSGDLDFRTTGGVIVEPSRALDVGRLMRHPVVVGDGSANLYFRSMSGEQRVSAVSAAPEATPPERPVAPPAADPPTATYPTTPAAYTRLDVLRALERGDIDVDEAARRLEEVRVDA